MTINASPVVALAFADRCWTESIPLITVRSVGFFGSLRVQIPEATFVENPSRLNCRPSFRRTISIHPRLFNVYRLQIFRLSRFRSFAERGHCHAGH